MERTEALQQRIQQFLDEEDLLILEKPITFEKTTKYNNYALCCGLTGACLSFGVSLFCPIQACCPHTMFEKTNLRVDGDSVYLSKPYNDFCCHVALNEKTVPLTQITDVGLADDCILTCFGLKQIRVQTASSGAETAEIAADFIKNPEEARTLIQLAARKKRENPTGAPTQQGMSRSGLASRLDTLNTLVYNGALNESEAASIKLAVLAADVDMLPKLVETKQLFDRGLLSETEYNQLKSTFMRKLQASVKIDMTEP